MNINKASSTFASLRQINGIEEPAVIRDGQRARGCSTSRLTWVRGLHRAEFETLADLIFARSGWQRPTNVGENLADVGIVMEQLTTAETIASSCGFRPRSDYVSPCPAKCRGHGGDLHWCARD